MREIKQFTAGLSFILKGYRSIRSIKGLWLWTIVPLVIDLFLLIYFLSFGFSNLSIWVASALGFIFSDPTGWLYGLIYYPLYLILFLGFMIVSIYGVYLVASVVASPFHSVIVERVLIHRGVIADKPFSVSRWLKVSLRMLGVALVRATILGLFGIVLFISSFIPGFNIASSFLALLIMAFDSMDYTYELCELNLKERFRHLQANVLGFSGMASVIGITLVIPGLILFLMPMMVAGAAEYYSQKRSLIN